MTLTIRPASREDAASIASIYAPYCRLTAISFEFEPPSEEEVAQRIEAVLARHLPWLVCTDAEGVLGYAYARPYQERAAYKWTLESSIYLAESSRGRGVGRALYMVLLDIVRAQGYCSVAAGITLPNEASVRLHESLGFEPVGVYAKAGYKLGDWHDVSYWRRALRSTEAEPPEPAPFDKVADSPWCHTLIANALAELQR
jgi:L-amino acid N-acyltransferase YncA